MGKQPKQTEKQKKKERKGITKSIKMQISYIFIDCN